MDEGKLVARGSNPNPARDRICCVFLTSATMVGPPPFLVNVAARLFSEVDIYHMHPKVLNR